MTITRDGAIDHRAVHRPDAYGRDVANRERDHDFVEQRDGRGGVFLAVWVPPLIWATGLGLIVGGLLLRAIVLGRSNSV